MTSAAALVTLAAIAHSPTGLTAEPGSTARMMVEAPALPV
jgi:hypothetical protein